MGADRINRIDHEVQEIHTQIKKANLVLRQRMRDIQVEMEEWTLGGTDDGKSNDNGYMR